MGSGLKVFLGCTKRLRKGPEVEYTVTESVLDEAHLETSDFYVDGDIPGEPEPQAYALKLDVASLRVHYVSGIKGHYNIASCGSTSEIEKGARRRVSGLTDITMMPEFLECLTTSNYSPRQTLH
jgi:hypothetical protein